MNYKSAKKALVGEEYLARTATTWKQANRSGQEQGDLTVLRTITSKAFTDVTAKAVTLHRFDVDAKARAVYIDTMFDALQENLKAARKLAHKFNNEEI